MLCYSKPAKIFGEKTISWGAVGKNVKSTKEISLANSLAKYPEQSWSIFQKLHETFKLFPMCAVFKAKFSMRNGLGKFEWLQFDPLWPPTGPTASITSEDVSSAAQLLKV